MTNIPLSNNKSLSNNVFVSIIIISAFIIIACLSVTIYCAIISVDIDSQPSPAVGKWLSFDAESGYYHLYIISDDGLCIYQSNLIEQDQYLTWKKVDKDFFDSLSNVNFYTFRIGNGKYFTIKRDDPNYMYSDGQMFIKINDDK